MQGGEFFPYPMTERVANMTFSSLKEPSKLNTIDLLSIGVQHLTHDHIGLKIPPTHHVVIAIGTDGNPEENAFALSPSTARAIAKRILEMADEAEKQDAA